jgi:hypothetical protein
MIATFIISNIDFVNAKHAVYFLDNNFFHSYLTAEHNRRILPVWSPTSQYVEYRSMWLIEKSNVGKTKVTQYSGSELVEVVRSAQI